MKIKVETFMVYKDCECGGIFNTRVNKFTYATFPEQRDYMCSKCTKQMCLKKEDWPHLEYEDVEDVFKKGEK